MSFLRQAQAFAEAVGWAPPEGAPPAAGPVLDARGVTTYCPWAMARAAARAAVEGREAPAEVQSGGEAPGLGSSVGANSENPVRTGVSGITSYGRRMVRRACEVLEEDRPCLAFWTVTLPDEAMAEVQRLDCWARFQDALRHRLVELLRGAGLPPLVVGVAELHPQRTRRTGRPCPHLHVAFVGRRNRWHAWAIDRWRLDAAIGQALGRCGIAPGRLDAAGNVQPVRKSVGRYLGKYISKAGAAVGVCGRRFEGMPKQWWFLSRPLLHRVVATTVPLPLGFLEWLHESREGLASAGVLDWGKVDCADPRAPAIFWIVWRDGGGLLSAWEAWSSCP